MFPGISNAFGWVGRPCPYCGAKMGVCEQGSPLARSQVDAPRYPTRDHLLPRSRGGTNAAKNIAICCRCCNGDKGDRTPREWLAALADVYDPRAMHVARFMAGDYDPGPPSVEAVPVAHQRGIMQKLYEHYERIDARPKQYIRYEWTVNGLASHPAGDRAESRRHAMDDEGREGDPA